MGRQTHRNSTGKAFFKPADPDCGSCRNCDRLVGCMGRWAEALAAYEDTGLEPEEIQEAVDLFPWEDADIPAELKRWVERSTWHIRRCNELSKELQAYRASGLTPDELTEAAELYKAEKEGRVVETCTYSQEDIDSSVWDCSACGAAWSFECDGPIENNTRFCPECGAKIMMLTFREWDEDGDVVDREITRAEAEAALGGGGNEDYRTLDSQKTAVVFRPNTADGNCNGEMTTPKTCS